MGWNGNSIEQIHEFMELISCCLDVDVVYWKGGHVQAVKLTVLVHFDIGILTLYDIVIVELY